jgi:hypothetical protein
MLGINKEIARIAQEQPTQDRLRGLKRIIPAGTIKSILKKTHQTAYCSRLPKWFMVWFVIALGLFNSNSYRPIVSEEKHAWTLDFYRSPFAHWNSAFSVAV